MSKDLERIRMQLDWLDYWWPLALIGVAGVLMASFCFGWVALRLLRILRGLRRAARPTVSRPNEARPGRRPTGWLRLAAAISFGCVGLAFSSMSFALLSQLYAYRALTAIELVGEFKCEERVGPNRFQVSYTAIDSGRKGKPVRVQLRGEQWLLGADILRWHPFMSYLGFHASYKVTRLEGRYTSASDQSSKPITAIDLAGGSDTLFLTLYRQKWVWPYSLLIDSVYGSAVYQFMEPGETFEVFIGRDGLVTKPKSKDGAPTGSG